MNTDDETFQENEHAAPAAERRSGAARRKSDGRRRTDSTGAALDAPAPDLFASTSLKEPKNIRKFHFRSFEGRRGGTDRRACSCDHENKSSQPSQDAENEHLAANEAAGRPQRES